MRVAEFFAGIGLVRMALEQEGFEVVWANDIDAAKGELYRRNFAARELILDDIRNIHGSALPDIDLATASFPCTDLSLAGNRLGLNGKQSGLFWEFARVLDELRERRPQALLIENVPSFATSHRGEDLRLAIERLNRLGYSCDMLVIDARYFVPQSRPRLFIIGLRQPIGPDDGWLESAFRPGWLRTFAASHPELRLHSRRLDIPTPTNPSLDSIVERLPADDDRWWDAGRFERFTSELSPRQAERLVAMTQQPETVWATAYRRTRSGRPAWEIRADDISGCLRTARGGSSRQALVEAGYGAARVRWMTGAEYARLQGAPDYDIAGFPEQRVLFGFGDAVCVPVIAWLAREYLAPLLAYDLMHGERAVMDAAPV